MGLLSTSTLRFTLLLWFTASFSFASPKHRNGDPTARHRIIGAVTRGVTRAVTDSENRGRVDQGSASDGAGSGFDIPTIVWVSFGLTVGSYLTLGGMRVWRMTTAFAIGLVLAICAWVAIVNATNAAGLTDLVLTLITLTFFVLGSLGGLSQFCRLAGLTALSIIGGMSVGMRIVLMREGLFLRPKALNWIVIVMCAVAGSVATLLRQRIGIALSCTFTGTFLISLGVDLTVNQQNGVSRGLRHLLDGNAAHVLALSEIPYNPPISTQIILGVSVLFALATAYLQFRLFSGYLEEPSHAQPFIKPPENYSSNRFSL